MNINIINESSYKKLNVVCNGENFSLNKGNLITIYNVDNNAKIEIEVLEKIEYY